MADDSPVIHHSLRHYKNSHTLSNLQSDNLVSDEELSVGGTTPPPRENSSDVLFSPENLKDEQHNSHGMSEDEKESVASATNIIKFSIDNILNPEFGRMNAAESAAAMAFHTHHHHLIQQQQLTSPVNTSGGFLGTFHPLPFLAAARQMILAATAAVGSPIDYNQQPNSLVAHHASVAQAISHPHSLNGMLLAHHSAQHPTTLNLVESCTDKYLGGPNNKRWPSPQSTVSNSNSISTRSYPLPAMASAASGAGIKAKVPQISKSQQQHSGSKAMDLTVRSSVSPDPIHRITSGVITEKSSASLISSSFQNSADDSLSASPVRSVSVSGSTCSAGNSELTHGSGSVGGSTNQQITSSNNADKETLWPAWVYCTRYSDRPSSGPRARRIRTKKDRKAEEKRPRTAFTSEQLSRLKSEFTENRYLTEKRRQDLARELQLHENQIKIWFQNKRAKIKKASGQKNPLALQLMAQGLYNHSTMALDEDDEDDDEMLQQPE